MNTNRKHRRQWRIGELAESAGVTVRTLHHYEETGLLASTLRTEGGHRVYDDTGVERIYRIRALRELGLSLEEVRRTLEGGAALGDLLAAHLERIEAQLAQLTRLRDRLGSLTSRAGVPVDTDDLLAALDAMSTVERHALARRRDPKVPAADREKRWRRTGRRLRDCLADSADPASARVQAVALEARALLHEFAGGDPAVLQALAHLRATSPPRNLAGWTPELMRYLDLALAALPPEPPEEK